MTTFGKSLWASVQGDPVFMRRVNRWLAIFWIVMIPVSYEMGWLNSVTYVSALSLWALVSGHWSAWQAARVEVNQAAEAFRHEKSDPAIFREMGELGLLGGGPASTVALARTREGPS
jgi:hypothetical protein